MKSPKIRMKEEEENGGRKRTRMRTKKNFLDIELLLCTWLCELLYPVQSHLLLSASLTYTSEGAVVGLSGMTLLKFCKRHVLIL